MLTIDFMMEKMSRCTEHAMSNEIQVADCNVMSLLASPTRQPLNANSVERMFFVVVVVIFFFLSRFLCMLLAISGCLQDLLSHSNFNIRKSQTILCYFNSSNIYVRRSYTHTFSRCCYYVATTAAPYKTGTLSFYHVSCQCFCTTENEGKKTVHDFNTRIQTQNVYGRKIYKKSQKKWENISRQNISLQLVANIFRYIRCILFFCKGYSV